MIKTLRKYNSIFWKFRQIHLMRTLEYRTDFFFWAFISIMWTFFNIFFFVLVFGVVDTIGGWSKHEVYLLLGIFTSYDAIIWGVFYFNMSRYTNSIYDGELNNLLLKPVNPVFLIMTRYNNYNNIFRFLTGVSIAIWAYLQLQLNLNLFQGILFFYLYLLCLILLYFLWFTISSLAFYVEKLDNINEIFPNLRRAWQVPRSVYTGGLSFFITYIFPIGLIVSLPAEALLGKNVVNLAGFVTVFTALIICISQLFFKHSIKRYSGMAN